jgi:exo-1,4-beta-D-glucosaminidase
MLCPFRPRVLVGAPAVTAAAALRLVLTDAAGREIDRNAYRLSTKSDVIDYSKNTWCHAPTSSFVDAHVPGSASTPVLPVRWSDNEVSLWPGESATLTATYRTSDLKGATPSVRVSGWNVATSTAR